MPRREVEQTVRQSLLDRLIDREPKQPTDKPRTWTGSVREMKESVRRDLEWLLNTRRIVDPAPEALTEVSHSLYHYGLPDITSLSADSPKTRAVLLRQVEEAIRLFEPRVTDIRISLIETEDEEWRKIRFLIEGMLQMEPSPEDVTFDTVLEISSGAFEVR